MSKHGFEEFDGGEILPKLEPSDIPGAGLGKVVQLTISRAWKQAYRENGQVVDMQVFVEFHEARGKALRCNKTQIAAFAALVQRGFLPNSFEEITNTWNWDGVFILMTVQEFSFNSRSVLKLIPVAVNAYADALAEFGADVPPSPRKRRRS